MSLVNCVTFGCMSPWTSLVKGLKVKGQGWDGKECLAGEGGVDSENWGQGRKEGI